MTTVHYHAPMKRVAVGLSGGVDSTMAACLLQRQGLEVVGITMQIWDGSLALPRREGRSGCYGPGEAQEIAARQALSARLGIPFQVVPLAEEYRREVLAYFRREYLAGHTPNPCVICNWKLKFGFLLEKARASGLTFDKFATGHYARTEIAAATGRVLLKRGRDPAKDQSYFLYHLTQDQLRQVVFPLGDLTKKQVKILAVEFGFAELATRPESQDFIACRDYPALFAGHTIRPGPIVDLAGRVLGEHRGIIHYTIGQRKGVGLSGAKEPLYVVKIDGPRNTITVGSHADLFRRRLQATNLNWIAFETLTGPRRFKAKIRQQHRAADATVTPDPRDAQAASVVFDQPQLAIAPGQAVVFYQDDIVLGGGTIE